MAKRLSPKNHIQFLVRQGSESFTQGHEKLLIPYDPDHPEAALELIGDGYVALLEDRPLKKALNPSALLQAEFPQEENGTTYYQIIFKGKQSEEKGGLMFDAATMRSLLARQEAGQDLDLVQTRILLEKQGFREEEVRIHMECPFDGGESSLPSLKQRLLFSLKWNTTMPLKEFRNSSLKKYSLSGENPLFRLAFPLAALIVFILLPILSQDAGLSGDDEKHYQHAAKVYRYFTEDDPAALDDPVLKLNYYGQSFDFFTFLVIKRFGLEEHAYEARHFMVAITGAAAILFTGLLVRLFAGYAGGLLAMVLMFLSPRFLGHAFNNPMDVPFLLGNIFTIYHLVRFLKKLPRISPWSALWVALGIAWTNGIRIGGLLLVPYLFMFSGLYLLLKKWPWKSFSKDWWFFALKGLGVLVLISFSGYLLSLLTWPYALQDIINHPIQSFKIMTNIQVSIRVLYDGVTQWSDRLPWHYIPQHIWLTVPVLVLLAFFASLVSWYLDRKKHGYWYFMLWFTILFPMLFIIYRKSNVYGGWRHMMFIYPSMVALAAMSLVSFFRKTRHNWQRYLLLGFVVAGCIHPLRHIIRNHPNTYVYFNEWSGGINRVCGTLETDYYANSLKPATDYFIEEILPELEEKGEQITVASNSNLNYYFRNNRDLVKLVYGRYYNLGVDDWDYAILYCNYLHQHHLNASFWPPKNTIYEVRVDTVTVAAIVERKSRAGYYGADLLDRGMREQDPEKLEKALEFLESEIEYDPHNFPAYLELENAYSAFLEFGTARRLMDRLLEIYPGYDKALNSKGYSYLLEAEYTGRMDLLDESIRWINEAIRSNYKFYSGYYNLGLAYGLKNDPGNAEYNLKQAIMYNVRFIEAYDKLAGLYESMGDPEAAQLVRQQANRWR